MPVRLKIYHTFMPAGRCGAHSQLICALGLWSRIELPEATSTYEPYHLVSTASMLLF